MSSSLVRNTKLTPLKTIHDLEEAIGALPLDDSKKKSGTGSKNKEKHGKEVFGLFRKRTGPLTATKPFLTSCLQPDPTLRRRTRFRPLIPALMPVFMPL